MSAIEGSGVYGCFTLADALLGIETKMPSYLAIIIYPFHFG